MSILSLLGLSERTRSTPEADSLAERIRKRCTNLTEERAEIAACYAGLLLRVARADVHLSEEERAALPRLLVERIGVAEAEAALIAEITESARQLGDLDYSQLTRKLNEIARPEEKIALLDCLYAVATADDSISVVEDEEIRSVSRALLLHHAQFIEVRTRYKAKLAVLQGLRSTGRS